MTDHNIVAASPTPLVERPPQALADNAAHENADLFAQGQSVFTQHNISKKFYPVLAANVLKPVDIREKNTRQGVAPQDTHDVHRDLVTPVQITP